MAFKSTRFDRSETRNGSVALLSVKAGDPKHRRSKLVQLTRTGAARYGELNAQLLAIASTMGVALDEADIRKTAEVVRQLSDDVKVRSERLG
ncbi:MAG: hypothetical protein E5W98_13015 [Mesorhizobium sp.]|nr:MAG: hypothetical protein E5W98_13015 [Mesorhizobium sp.]